MPAALSSASPPSGAQRAAQHLAPLAERRRGEPLHGREQARRPAASDAGVSTTTAENTFGGGTKAAGGMRSRSSTRQHPLRQHGKPPVRRAARRGGDAFGHFLLEHQRQPLPRRAWRSQPTSSGEATLYGRLATIWRGGGTSAARSSASASARPPRAAGRPLAAASSSIAATARRIDLDRRHLARRHCQQRARQPAGARARPRRRGGRQASPAWRGDPRGQVAVEQEMLAERRARIQPVPRDDLAQRRQANGGIARVRASGVRRCIARRRRSAHATAATASSARC